MGITDTSEQGFIGQGDFSGGVNMLAPAGNQAADALNMMFRSGKPKTRGGVRKYLDTATGLAGFWFNEDAEEYNDATHTGFWFPFRFMSAMAGRIQGAAVVRLSVHTENKIVFVVGGVVYIHEDGAINQVITENPISATDDVELIQAQDKVILFTETPARAQWWDGTDTGFVAVPNAIADSNMPDSSHGIYQAGRLWIADGDDIWASGALAFQEWDLTGRAFSVQYGSEEPGVTLYPFHNDMILCFKKHSIHALLGVNSAIEAALTLADYVTLAQVDVNIGCLARRSIVTIGEDVMWLGEGGFYSMRRNAENYLERNPTPVSRDIQPLVSRINWKYADRVCGTVQDNLVLWSVPLDNSTTNNAVLVFDKQLNGGLGGWCGLWKGASLNPAIWLHDGSNLIFVSEDSRVRKALTGDPWDTEDVFDDCQDYDGALLYEPGDVVYYEDNGDKVFRCLATSLGNLPTDADFWEEIADAQHALDIESMVLTRPFMFPEMQIPMRAARAEAIFRHQNPMLELSELSREHGTERTLFAGIEYSQEQYDVVLPDWDETNTNLDANDPHRKDYTLLVGADGIYADAEGIYAEAWELHTLRWPVLNVQLFDWAVRVRSTRGKLELQEVKAMIMGRRFTNHAAA